jgi:hypothetical protein
MLDCDQNRDRTGTNKTGIEPGVKLGVDFPSLKQGGQKTGGAGCPIL